MSENANRKRRRRFSRSKDKSREEPKVEREAPPCCVCGKPIRDILAALLHREKGEPAHFDCIAKEILAGETLAEGERFTYLGSGVFGIFRQGKKSRDPSSIVIRKKIEYEDKEKAAAWKRSLSVKV